jgi:SAM-dependent methyltransferase
MANNPEDILKRVSTLENGDSSRDIYDDWSAIYDNHLHQDFGYISPQIAARALAETVARRDIAIIDYGCGTGLVAEALRREDFTAIDGIDISQGMLARARDKRVYRHLACGDLTAAIALADSSYDAGTCIGSMGAGHVSAAQLPEMLRPLRPGAPLVIIMNGAYYQSGGFAAAFHELESAGAWQIRRLEEFNYMTELDRPGWLLVAEKEGSER